MGSLPDHVLDVKTIAIIGAGPCGLSAAKYLLAEKCFEQIVVFEQSDEVGGVWNYSSATAPLGSVPQTNPFPPVEEPLQRPGKDGAPAFPSPMYEHLYANIPAPLMQYGDTPFPSGPGSTIFPSRQVVEDYLIDYARDFRHLIRFSTQVTNVEHRDRDGRDQWAITSRSFGSGGETHEVFDAVVMASGHYSAAFIPEVTGMKEFNEAHPGIITHAKVYRNPREFAGKKTLVIGNAASGLDIAAQISRHCAAPLLFSVHTATAEDHLAYIEAKEVPAIQQYLPETRGVRFEGDGGEVHDIDAIVYCTGYLYTLPFFSTRDSPLSPFITNGRGVHGLYKHLISIKHPTLVFPGLPIKIVPFPMSESQAAVISRVWANRLKLPTRAEMEQWEKEEERRALERGPLKGGGFHVFLPGGDSVYMEELHDWAMSSSRSSFGIEPPVWNDELKWLRKLIFQAKLKFDQQGQTATTLEEIGIQYDPLATV